MNQSYSAHNYYEVLEVSSLAPQHEVHRAYLKAKETYSPNSPALYTMFTKEEADELLKLIEEAFLVLSDPLKRRKYDEYLKQKEIQHGNNLPDFAAPIGEDYKSNLSGPPLLEMLASKTVSEKNIPTEDIEMEMQSLRKQSANLEKLPESLFSKKAEIPQGFQKTKMSVYEEISSMENEIKTATEFTGELLQRIRQYKNIDLASLSAETRISKTYLAAIESEDYDGLPAPVFVRGFVVQVAKVLGLEPDKVASSYMARLKRGS